MDLGLKDKVVMITGGSRGIGRAISLAFAAEGARLALCSRDPGPLGEVVEKIRSHWRSDVYAAEADMRRPEEVEQFVRGALVHFGRVDVLVNNVGAGLLRGFEELTEEEWQDALTLNLMAAIRCSRAVLPAMRSHGGGAIVNLAALSGQVPRQGQIASNVAKAGLINFTESLACEVGKDKIRVNAVGPIAIRTIRWEKRVTTLARERGVSEEEVIQETIGQIIPLKRLGEPEDVASAVLFLASERAAFITGVMLMVDGGMGRCVRLG